MSVNRDMKTYGLEYEEITRTESGAEKSTWKFMGEVKVAIYKKNDMGVVASEKYVESTHAGLTYRKDIVAYKNRLVRNGVIYQVTDSNPQGRLTYLFLKVVE